MATVTGSGIRDSRIRFVLDPRSVRRSAVPDPASRPQRPRPRIERRHVGQVGEVGRDGRQARGECAQPRARHFARGRPAQVDRYVARGQVVGRAVVVWQIAGHRSRGARGLGRAPRRRVEVLRGRAGEEQACARRVGQHRRRARRESAGCAFRASDRRTRQRGRLGRDAVRAAHARARGAAPGRAAIGSPCAEADRLDTRGRVRRAQRRGQRRQRGRR